MKTEIRIHKRPDGKFVYEIFCDNQSQGFIHWIESTDGRICRVNRADMVMSPVWSAEQAEGECAWLNHALLEGKIK
jgi:hypothetical protein